MKRTVIIFLSFFWLGNLSSQNWVNMIDSMPNSYTTFKTGVVDHNTNTLYLGGLFQQVNNFVTNSIIKYNGSTFDTLASGIDPDVPRYSGGDVRALAMFQNKLYVGGSFNKAGKYISKNLARWNGSDWDSTNFNVHGTIAGMEVHNNELYVSGGFDTICGVAANNVAKFDGINWYSLNFPALDANIIDIAIFKDTLYATGPFYEAGFSVLAKYNGTMWVPWRGVTGDANKGIWGLKTIDTMLYVYGRFWGIDGKIGNGLMAYNGKNWYSLGGGVTPTYYCYISDITKINNEFYISGNFDFIDGITNSNGLLNYNTNAAKFDGDKWCTYLPSVKFPTFFTIEYNNETYIAGAFDTVGTVDALPLIKFTGSNSVISCGNSVGVGLKEITVSDNIKIYPNPATSVLNIDDEQNELRNTTIQITNTLGETVKLLPFTSQIDISVLDNGIYFLNLQNNKAFKFIKQK